MNEKEKAIFKLEEAKQRCNWVITQTKSGVIPNGRNIEDLQEAKDIMEARTNPHRLGRDRARHNYRQPKARLDAENDLYDSRLAF